MYASTGIATDSARQKKANSWARWLAIPCRKLFQARPMPELQMPRAKARAAGFVPGNSVALSCIRAIIKRMDAFSASDALRVLSALPEIWPTSKSSPRCKRW